MRSEFKNLVELDFPEINKFHKLNYEKAEHRLKKSFQKSSEDIYDKYEMKLKEVELPHSLISIN